MEYTKYQYLLQYAIKNSLNKYFIKKPISSHHLSVIRNILKLNYNTSYNIGYNLYLLSGYYGLYTDKFEYQLKINDNVYGDNFNHSIIVDELLGKELQTIKKICK